MSEIKFFEIRDCGTTLPVMACKILPTTPNETWLYKRAGFSLEHPCIQVTYLAKDVAHYDPYEWGQVGARTVKNAHAYIEKHFDDLVTGSVIDVEFLLGESDKPKVSENRDYIHNESLSSGEKE